MITLFSKVCPWKNLSSSLGSSSPKADTDKKGPKYEVNEHSFPGAFVIRSGEKLTCSLCQKNIHYFTGTHKI